jgi:hypothetical protein
MPKQQEKEVDWLEEEARKIYAYLNPISFPNVTEKTATYEMAIRDLRNRLAFIVQQAIRSASSKGE